MERGDQDHPGIGDGRSRGRVPRSCEGDGLSKTLTFSQNVKNSFVAGWSYPIQLDPATNDDEECCRRFTLSKQCIAWFEIYDSCRGEQLLHHSGIKAAQHSRLTGSVQIIRRRSCHGFNPSVLWTSACFVACSSKIMDGAGKDLTQINFPVTKVRIFANKL